MLFLGGVAALIMAIIVLTGGAGLMLLSWAVVALAVGAILN